MLWNVPVDFITGYKMKMGESLTDNMGRHLMGQALKYIYCFNLLSGQKNYMTSPSYRMLDNFIKIGGKKKKKKEN